jgi:insecticidal toxin complex protein TccC
MTANLHWRTPALSVSDARGLPVRQIAYLRGTADDPPAAQVSRQQHDHLGRLVEQWDPRLSAPCLRTVYSLDGSVLKSDSVDAGWRLTLPGLAGEPLQRWDQRGSCWRTTFDEQLRVIALEENSEANVEVFTYADASADAQYNRRGQLLEHKDRSGSLLTNSFSLSGQALNETRTFHDDQAFTSLHVFSPLGALLEQTDAGGHQRRSRYGLAGQLKQVDLLISGTPDWQPVLRDAQYNANDQIIEQLAGNRVLSEWAYEPADGRLHTQSSRKDGGAVLQNLEYFYDPVGNITRIEDHAFQPRYFANQLIDGHRDFTYDSLYRLTSATGYDDAPPPDIPGLPLPSDPNNRLNYTQTYKYDSGSNLIELCHVRAGNNSTRHMRIDPHSNRGVRWTPGEPEPVFDELFDPHGNQRSVQPGQPLQWNVRDELEKVTLISRENARSDAEHYRYSQGVRVFKRHETFAANAEHFHQVRYLPGLEIRTRDNGEELHVISLGNARCLHWTKNKPDEIDVDQLRYSLEDHLGSCVMELDQQGDLTSQEGYYPFGETAWMAARHEVEVRYRFIRYSGKEMDVSGLYYYGARYYAPWLQRWISADPAGDVDGLNLYGFVGNNPLRYFDAQGQQRTSSELLTVAKDYENLLAVVTRELDKSIYQLSHLNSTRDIYRSSGKRAVLTLLNVLASAITAAAAFTAGSVVGTAATFNPVTGLAVGIGAAALAADMTGAEIDKLGENNAFGYKLLPDSADYDVGRLTEEAQPKSLQKKIKSLFTKYDPSTTDGNKESLIVGTIGVLDDLTGGTHLEKFLAFLHLSAEVTEALNDSLGQRDLDLVEQSIELTADYVASRKELYDQALAELEGLGREHIATAKGTRYRLSQVETAVLGKMNRVIELLPRVSAHIQQKNAAKR